MKVHKRVCMELHINIDVYMRVYKIIEICINVNSNFGNLHQSLQ